MKKVYLWLTGIAIAACQPQEPEITPVNPYQHQIKVLHTLLTEQLSKSLAQPFKIVPAPAATNPYRYARTHGEDLEINSSLSLEQINISSNFINAVWDVEGTAGVYSMVDQYENQIAYAALTEEEKFELFTIGESVRVTAEFLDSGGADEIYNLTVAALPPDEPVPARKDPCIEVKDIMQGAVLGGFVGAGIGGFYGCTVGTFTVPIIGTATGCVGGAVFGFAEGFFGGVISAGVQQLIFKCFMKATLRFVPEKGAWYDYEDLYRNKNAGSLILTIE